MSVFSKRLKELRTDRKLTLDELAKQSQTVQSQTLGRYENDERIPDIYVVAKLADFFDVSVDYLIGVVNTPTKKPKIQAICKHTGLSQKALETILKLNHHNRNSLNTFLENANFVLLFTRLLLLQGNSLDFVGSNTEKDLSRLSDNCDVQRLRITELMIKIMDSFDERTKNTDITPQAQEYLNSKNMFSYFSSQNGDD